MVKIVVGLGNIGEKYDNTRHNLGFMFLDYLSKSLDISIDKKMTKSKIGEVIFKKEKIIFLKPETYMNLSGEAVVEIKNFYKVEDKDIIIIYDDIDIEFGEIKYKESSSSGSHNGMKNILQLLKTNKIARIKIGIGGIKKDYENITDFVLNKFTKEEKSKLPNIFDKTNNKLKEFLLNKTKKVD